MMEMEVPCHFIRHILSSLSTVSLSSSAGCLLSGIALFMVGLIGWLFCRLYFLIRVKMVMVLKSNQS